MRNLSSDKTTGYSLLHLSLPLLSSLCWLHWGRLVEEEKAKKNSKDKQLITNLLQVLQD